VLDAVLTQYDARAGTRKVTLLAEGLPEALAGRRIDALLAVGDPTDNEFTEIVSSVAACLPADSGGESPVPALSRLRARRCAARLLRRRPAADLRTIGVSTRLVARTKAADGTVGEMVRVLFARRPLIAAAAPLANRMEEPSTDKSAAFPVHPGAAAYLDGDEESFLDKYSDFIYIGAMLLSVLASAAAALASRMNAANHARSEELMQLLLQHLATAREAASSARLDELEREADTVLGQALEAGSLRHLDTHRVTALGLAIDQVRLAIRDRRRQIEAGDPTARVETPRILAG